MLVVGDPRRLVGDPSRFVGDPSGFVGEAEGSLLTKPDPFSLNDPSKEEEEAADPSKEEEEEADPSKEEEEEAAEPSIGDTGPCPSAPSIASKGDTGSSESPFSPLHPSSSPSSPSSSSPHRLLLHCTLPLRCLHSSPTSSEFDDDVGTSDGVASASACTSSASSIRCSVAPSRRSISTLNPNSETPTLLVVETPRRTRAQNRGRRLPRDFRRTRKLVLRVARKVPRFHGSAFPRFFALYASEKPWKLTFTADRFVILP